MMKKPQLSPMQKALKALIRRRPVAEIRVITGREVAEAWEQGLTEWLVDQLQPRPRKRMRRR